MAFFDDSQNPFSDPSIRNATQPSQPATIDFNPFEQETVKTIAAKPPQPAQPAQTWSGMQAGAQAFAGGSTMMQEELPPPYAANANERLTSEELERRQRELELKAAEIERREQELLRHTTAAGTINNWPPLPACCPIKPCYYQDFDLEIAASYRSLVRFGYYLVLAHIVSYLLNVIIGFAYFIVSLSPGCTGTTCTTAGTTFGMAILWLLIFSPAAYACWFRPLYKAFKNDSSINFFWFFLVTIAQLVVDIIWALGFPGSGSIGIINGISLTAGASTNYAMAGFMLFLGCLSGLMAAADLMLLIRVHNLYRTTGASFEKAKQELARGAFSSDVMRGAVAAGVHSAVAGSSEAANSDNTGSSGRF